MKDRQLPFSSLDKDYGLPRNILLRNLALLTEAPRLSSGLLFLLIGALSGGAEYAFRQNPWEAVVIGLVVALTTTSVLAAKS